MYVHPSVHTHNYTACQTDSSFFFEHSSRNFSLPPDSDSLNEFHEIRLVEVFDTSVYNSKIKETTKRDYLKNTLTAYGCPNNSGRHPREFYDSHPNYWLERPLTEKQITSAAQDVAFLFLLHESILERMLDMNISSSTKLQIQHASENAISEFREKRYTALVEVPRSKFGLVIGRGGSTISLIEAVSGAVVRCSNDQGFNVLAASQANINSAKKMMKDKIKERRGYSHS